MTVGRCAFFATGSPARPSFALRLTKHNSRFRVPPLANRLARADSMPAPASLAPSMAATADSRNLVAYRLDADMARAVEADSFPAEAARGKSAYQEALSELAGALDSHHYIQEDHQPCPSTSEASNLAANSAAVTRRDRPLGRVDGRRCRRYVGGWFKTKEAAEVAEREALLERDQGLASRR